MQKTEKHCKNQCFCYHKTTKISPKTGPKTQKSASGPGPGHLRNRKKRLQTKKMRSKSWKTRVFFTFRLPILDGRVHEQVSSVLFFTVFFEGERHDLSKTGGFGRKMAPPQVNLQPFTSAIRTITPQHLRCGRISKQGRWKERWLGDLYRFGGLALRPETAK